MKMPKKHLANLIKIYNKKIKDYLAQIETLENPRHRGKALAGNLKGLWRYRVEDYRIIAKIEDKMLLA